MRGLLNRHGNNMAVIKDKKIQLCVCGREKKTETRTAKRRVSSWLGTAAAILFVVVILTYPEILLESFDLKTALACALMAYYTLGVIYKFTVHIQKHSFRCAFRRAWIEIV